MRLFGKVLAVAALLCVGAAEAQINIGGGGSANSGITLAQPFAGTTSLSGVAPKGVTVTIYKNGTSVGTAVANTSTGVWTYTLGSAASSGDVYLATSPIGAIATVAAAGCSNSLDFSQACNSALIGALGL